jgi:hypothetical protein
MDTEPIEIETVNSLCSFTFGFSFIPIFGIYRLLIDELGMPKTHSIILCNLLGLGFKL